MGHPLIKITPQRVQQKHKDSEADYIYTRKIRSVIGVKVTEEGIVFYVRWEPEPGQKDSPKSYVRRDLLRLLNPEALADFYVKMDNLEE